MVTLIRRIIKGLVAPSAAVSCSPPLWGKLIDDLNHRSAGKRESGAFLLGEIDELGHRIIKDFVLYDDLDPTCLRGGYIYLRSYAYRSLWEICKEVNLSVIADVHTHPGSSVAQSDTDKEHPMIAQKDHLAIILPNFGKTPQDSHVAGIYKYLGAHKWETLQNGRKGRQVLYVGRW